jgi:hypothetical protein
MFGLNGEILYAHRYMCELVKGAPPSPEHETAHSCGNAYERCVHPDHLSWKTRAENEQDKVAQGRADWMARHGKNSKLTPEIVADIRASYPKMTVTQLADKYSVTRSNIRKILKFETWPTGEYSWNRGPEHERG